MSSDGRGLSFKLLMKNIKDDNKIHVLFEDEDNEACDHGTWVYFTFDTMKKCANYFLENHYTCKDKGDMLYGLRDRDIVIDDNKLDIDVLSGNSFVFQNNKNCNRFLSRIKKFIDE